MPRFHLPAHLVAHLRRIGRLGAATLLAAGAAGAVTASLAPVVVPAASAASAASAVPIVLVHGFTGSPAEFSVMEARLGALGRTSVAIDLPGQDNVANAKAIRDLVKARGWKKVAIVGHSMGGLSARQYIKALGGTAVVTAYVSLGTPQRGLDVACPLPLLFGGQICPQSTFMRRLNKGDPTPGKLAWTSIFSATDGIVPTSASRLGGGACNVRVTGPDHAGLLTDPSVFRLIVDAIDRKPCRGTFVK